MAVLKPSAYATQVGGDHYKKLAIQPLQYALANNLNAGQTLVLRYITRYLDKDGVKDLRKAIHVLELLIEHEEAKPAPACAATGMHADDVAELQRMRDAPQAVRKIVDYPVVFAAPQGWGKTARGAELAKEFGCVGFTDLPENPGTMLVDGVLYFTNIQVAREHGRPRKIYHNRTVRVVSRGWKMQADFDTGPPGAA